MEERDFHLLQNGKKLHDRYVIEDILGEGGFGITYKGRDELLGVQVAIKEFYPHGIVVRNNSVDDSVTVTSTQQKDIFDRGKQKFLEEAKVIARFINQDGIVNVTDFFESNNTAYIVMEYLQGITLKEYIKQNGCISAQDLLILSSPLLEALDEVHKQGLIHRDISPDNIMLMENGKVKLMDFGAARDYTEFGEKSLSIVLKPGYAPEEQYRTRGIQGPWTDIYAFSATLYKCLTGITPEESMQRVIEDSLKSPSDLGLKLPAGMEYAIMKGLAVFQKDRYQNLKDYCQDLYSETPAEEEPAPVSAPDLSEKSKRENAEKANVSSPDKQQGKGGKNKILILIAAVVIIALLIVFLGRGGNDISSSPDSGNSNFEVLDKK